MPELVFIYLFGVNLFASLCGLTGHFLIRYLRLDIQFPLFRFKNEWYYLFRGEALAFDKEGSGIFSRQEINEVLAQISGAYVTLVIEQGEKPYLYRGILKEFYFNREGDLDRLVLIGAHRRLLYEDPEPDESRNLERDDRYYTIEGQYFIVRYNSVKTLNIEYFRLEEA